MLVREVRLDEKEKYNALVSHPVQSWEWGEFKKITGAEVIRLGLMKNQNMVSALQLSFHRVPKTNYTIGYFPKGKVPDKFMLRALEDAGRRERAIFIKLEPDSRKEESGAILETLFREHDLRPSKPVFSPHTFQVDLRKEEEELLAEMKPKTRYNIRLAQRNGVIVEEDDSTIAFETYLRLNKETAERQGFYAHNEDYHRLMWKTLKPAGIAHLLAAKYQGEILVTWIVFVFNGILYYPYGASSDKYRNFMASNLMMWETMRFGKKLGCTSFDMWGALGETPNPKDPWYGFHRFKEGYGGELVEFVGAYDLVIDPQIYPLFLVADKVRWKLLRLLAKFR